MTRETSTRTVLVPKAVAEALLTLGSALDDELRDTLKQCLAGTCLWNTSPSSLLSEASFKPGHGGYEAEYLGTEFAARTLPEVLARIVDMTAEVAPEVLVALAKQRARKRRYIARTREEVHPGNQHLPAMKTASGWWISKNIGREDLIRTLRALCRTSGLDFGEDLRFRLRRAENSPDWL